MIYDDDTVKESLFICPCSKFAIYPYPLPSLICASPRRTAISPPPRWATASFSTTDRQTNKRVLAHYIIYYICILYKVYLKCHAEGALRLLRRAEVSLQFHGLSIYPWESIEPRHAVEGHLFRQGEGHQDADHLARRRHLECNRNTLLKGYSKI